MPGSSAASDPPLRGVRVVDFGQYLAGPLAALLLADQGAEVVRIERPGGPSWQTPANAMLLRGRDTHQLDLTDAADRAEANRLARGADVLVENFRPGAMDRLGLGPDVLGRENPRLVYCSMPGFGRSDPRRGLPGWEGVVLAAAGGYDSGSAEMLHGEWRPTAGPAFSPLLLASTFAGMQAALGIAAALVARHRDGLGQLVEVPLYDSFFEAIGARALSYERNAPGGALLGAGFYRCAGGGYVSLVTVWHRHLEWFLRAAGADALIADGTADHERLVADADHRERLRQRLVELFMTRPALEWERLGQAAGVPIAALRGCAQWLDEPQAGQSGAIEDLVGPAGALRVPGPAVHLSDRGAVPAARPNAEPADATRPPLAGMRVLDMSRVLAAPAVSRILAELGADVVRADVAPGTSGAGMREPLFHESANRGKRCAVVDLRTDAGRARYEELVGRADVVVTNFTRTSLQRLGLDEASVRERAPAVVYAYLNTFGSTGPWADLRGYAEIANTVTGITARTLGEGPPSGAAPNVDLPRTPFTDYAAGVLGAFGAVLGLFVRATTSRASSVETSLVAAASYEQIPCLIEEQTTGARRNAPADGRDRPVAWGEHGWSPWQRIYRTGDGWLFVGIAEVHRAEFLRRLGCPPDADDVEARISDALARLSGHDAALIAVEAGGAAHDLTGIDELLLPDGPAARRGLRLAHESAEFGWVVQPGPSIRLERTPMRPGGLPTG